MPETLSAIPGTNVPTGASFVPGGPLGPVGTPGDTGDTGPARQTLTHLSADFDLPLVGDSADVEVENAEWIIPGQMLYIDTGNGETGLFRVTAKNGNTLTLFNPVTVGPPLEGPRGPTGDRGPTIRPLSNFLSLSGETDLSPGLTGSYLLCSGGEWTLHLPSPEPGLTYFIRNDMGLSAPSGPVTLEPLSGLIDGQASIQLLSAQECQLFTDGVNWRTFGLQREVVLGTLDAGPELGNNWLAVQLPKGFRSFEIDWDEFITTNLAGQYLFCQASIDGGQTWIGAYNRAYFLTNNSPTTVGTGYQSGTARLIPLVHFNNESTALPVTGKSLIFPGRAGVQGHVQGLGASWWSDRGNYQMIWAGYFSNSNRVNALRFQVDAGLSSLKATLKGRV